MAQTCVSFKRRVEHELEAPVKITILPREILWALEKPSLGILYYNLLRHSYSQHEITYPQLSFNYPKPPELINRSKLSLIITNKYATSIKSMYDRFIYKTNTTVKDPTLQCTVVWSEWIVQAANQNSNFKQIVSAFHFLHGFPTGAICGMDSRWLLPNVYSINIQSIGHIWK